MHRLVCVGTLCKNSLAPSVAWIPGQGFVGRFQGPSGFKNISLLNLVAYFAILILNFVIARCKKTYLSKKKVISNRGSKIILNVKRLEVTNWFCVNTLQFRNLKIIEFLPKFSLSLLKITQYEYLQYFKWRTFKKNSHLGSWLVFTGSC